jgi:hypothetical protein
MGVTTLMALSVRNHEVSVLNPRRSISFKDDAP